MTNGTYLRFYTHENRKHHHVLLYEWLLEQAKKCGIHGGSAFRAIAGYGRHGVLHEQHFFELAGCDRAREGARVLCEIPGGIRYDRRERLSTARRRASP